MKNNKTLLAAGVIAALASTPGIANPLDKTQFRLSGYVKADALFSSYSDGTLPSNNIGRDFYIPGLTPVGGVEEDTQFDAHVRQTRFRLTSDTILANGEKLTGVIEFDFLVTPEGNERISNSYLPRIRHGFIKYQNWLIGQTWTTFMDVPALPDTVDFIGSTDAITFGRQVMLRYSYGGLDVALENPETTLTPFGGGARIVTDDATVPDLIARYTHKADWGHIAVAGLLRELNYVVGDTIDTSETAYGISVTGKVKLGQDDIRFSVHTGTGLGRYSALNTANGGVLNANNEIEAIDTTGWGVSYRHIWNNEFRSTLSYSAFSADSPVELTGTGVTESTYSVRANLLYSPSKELTFGAEYTFANRELESGADGDMSRMQFMAKYAF